MLLLYFMCIESVIANPGQRRRTDNLLASHVCPFVVVTFSLWFGSLWA